MEFISYIDNDRNELLRENIIKIINNTTSNIDEIKELLIEYPNDYKKILDEYNNFLNNYDKKLFIKNISSMIYSFDRINLNKLKKLSDSYYKLKEDDKKHRKSELYKLLDKISRKIIEFGEPDFNNYTSENIFIPCSTKKKLGYCVKYKLIMDESKYENYINIFIDDIVNPIKRDYILSSILTSNVNKNFEFKKKTDEEIYINII